MKTRRALLMLVLGAAVTAAQAQTGKWPERPVRVVVPFPSGGTTDIVARMITARLSEDFGQQFVVDNRGGAGGMIGAEIAARANPDGYTTAIVASSYATNAALYRLPYDPVKGIAPIGMISSVPFILGIHASVKANDLKAFIDLAREKPGVLNFGTPGTGSTTHLSAELFWQMAKINMVHVPYKGAAPAIADLLAGQVHATFAAGIVLSPHIKAGKVRALAVTTAQRSRLMPDLPPIADVVPGYAVDGWVGMWAPAGTPKEIVSRLNQAILRIVVLPDLQDRLRAGGADSAPSTPDEFARLIARDVATWSKVIKVGNIKIN